MVDDRNDMPPEAMERKDMAGRQISRRDALAAALAGMGTLAGLPLADSRDLSRVEASGGTLVFGLSSYPPSFNPFLNTGTAAATVRLQVFRGLVRYDEHGQLRPDLAESWQAVKDQTFTFKLRANARFHSGDPVTAEDVKFSLEYMRDARNSAYLGPQMQAISRIDVLDSHTVRVRLSQPVATFLLYLAEPHAPIVSRRALSAKAGNFVGAGPFTMTQQEQGSKVVVTRYPHFYETGLPELKAIEFVAYADDTARVNALQAGNVDIIEYVPWQSMPAIRRNKNLVLQTTNGPFMYLLFNVTSGPFKDARVRQAIGYAINRKDILAAAFFNQGSALWGVPMPRSSPYYNRAYADFWTYDPEKARHMLAQAGVSPSFKPTLLSTAQYGMHKDTAEVVQAALSAIGLQVKLNLPDWPTRIALGNKGQYDFAVQGTAGDYNDPDFLTPFLSGPPFNNRSYGFNDAQINSLLAQGRRTTDTAQRKRIYDALQKRVVELAPIVGLTWRAQGYAFKTSVHGFHNLPGFLTFDSGYMLAQVSA
jgi:ABC-type transport system substrate-binding protein